jgi:hypothetical protein
MARGGVALNCSICFQEGAISQRVFTTARRRPTLLARSCLHPFPAMSRLERPNMTDAKLVMLSSFRQRRAAAQDAPSPAEGLKLVKAFLQIDDSKRRAEIIKMVEEASASKTG